MTWPTGTRGVATAVVSRRLGAALLLAALAACNDSGSRGFGGTELDFSAVNKPVQFTTGQGITVTARLYVPAGSGPFAAAVILHGCEGMLADTGLSAAYQAWGDRLRSGEGMVALIVDSFTPRGIAAGCGTLDTLLQDSVVNADTLVSEVFDRVFDAFAALAYLREQSFVVPERVAVFGFASGAGATLSALAQDGRPVALPVGGGFATAVAFYPDCALGNRYGTASTGTWLPYGPTHMIHGALDTLQADCASRVARAVTLGADSSAGNPVAMTTFAGAKHGFDRAVTGDAAWTAADVAARDQARLTLSDILRAM